MVSNNWINLVCYNVNNQKNFCKKSPWSRFPFPTLLHEAFLRSGRYVWECFTDGLVTGRKARAGIAFYGYEEKERRDVESKDFSFDSWLPVLKICRESGLWTPDTIKKNMKINTKIKFFPEEHVFRRFLIIITQKLYTIINY